MVAILYGGDAVAEKDTEKKVLKHLHIMLM
jgi:hypothetical protein